MERSDDLSSTSERVNERTGREGGRERRERTSEWSS